MMALQFPAHDLGTLEILPPELLREILMQVTVPAVINFAAVNHLAKSTVLDLTGFDVSDHLVSILMEKLSTMLDNPTYYKRRLLMDQPYSVEDMFDNGLHQFPLWNRLRTQVRSWNLGTIVRSSKRKSCCDCGRETEMVYSITGERLCYYCTFGRQRPDVRRTNYFPWTGEHLTIRNSNTHIYDDDVLFKLSPITVEMIRTRRTTTEEGVVRFCTRKEFLEKEEDRVRYGGIVMDVDLGSHMETTWQQKFLTGVPNFIEWGFEFWDEKFRQPGFPWR